MRTWQNGFVAYSTLLLLLLLAVITPSPARAGFNAWTSIGPNSDQVTMLAVDPVNTSVIYLMTVSSTHVQSAFKSVNSGVSWGSLNLSGIIVQGFAIDPSTRETLYVGTSSTVIKSIDGGGHWTPIYTAPANYVFNSFAVDPVDSDTLYACTTFNGVMKSIDGGYHWDSANSGMTASGVNVVSIDPANHATLYLGTTGGMFKSIDSGATWNPINTGLPLSGPTTTPVNAIAVNPLNNSTIYAATSEGMYKSTNGGSSWSAAGTGLPTFNTSVATLAIDPLQPARVYAGTSDGVYRSTNAGASWNAVNTGLTNTVVNVLAIDPQSPDNLYAGTDGGLFSIQFQDSGQYWLTYTKTGAGHGTVTSNPPGIDCTDSCSAQFDANSQVNLHAESDSGSFLVGWTGACTGISPDCTINDLDGDMSVSASFILQTEQMVMVWNNPPWIYFTLQTAYNAAQPAKEMWAMGVEFIENPVFDQDKEVFLFGGYDSSFDTSSDYTTINGVLTVGKGSLILKDIVVR